MARRLRLTLGLGAMLLARPALAADPCEEGRLQTGVAVAAGAERRHDRGRRRRHAGRRRRPPRGRPPRAGERERAHELRRLGARGARRAARAEGAAAARPARVGRGAARARAGDVGARPRGGADRAAGPADGPDGTAGAGDHTATAADHPAARGGARHAAARGGPRGARPTPPPTPSAPPPPAPPVAPPSVAAIVREPAAGAPAAPVVELLRSIEALVPEEPSTARIGTYQQQLLRVHRQVESIAARGAASPEVITGLRTVVRYYDAAEVAWEADEAVRERDKRPRHIPSSEGTAAPYFADSDAEATIVEFPFLRSTVVREPGTAVVEIRGCGVPSRPAPSSGRRDASSSTAWPSGCARGASCWRAAASAADASGL